MLISYLKKFFPVLILLTFSSVQASNTDDVEEIKTEIKQAFVEYTKKIDDLRKTEAEVTRLQAEKKKREIGVQRGRYNLSTDHGSILSMYKNGLVTLADVIGSEHNQYKENDPIILAQLEVQRLKNMTQEARSSLVELLGNTQE